MVKFSYMQVDQGLVYVFEGDGKGKTSAAIGTAVRMLLLLKKVEWISWFKSSRWQIAEARLPLFFGKHLKMYWAGEGFFIKGGTTERRGGKQVKLARTNSAVVFDTASPEVHEAAAKKALDLATKILAKKNPPELLVLDEVLQAVNDGLLSTAQVSNLIALRGKTHLVLTGHVCPENLKSEVDLVTQMVKIKHPYDKGVMAVRGLDF